MRGLFAVALYKAQDERAALAVRGKKGIDPLAHGRDAERISKAVIHIPLFQLRQKLVFVRLVTDLAPLVDGVLPVRDAVAAAKEHGDGHRLVRRQGADEIEIAVILAEKGVEIGNKFVAHA